MIAPVRAGIHDPSRVGCNGTVVWLQIYWGTAPCDCLSDAYDDVLGIGL
jgi:hypothetical protein